MSARKKSGKEEGLTAEESQKLKSLLEKATEPAANTNEQAGKKQEALTEEDITELEEALGPPTWQQVQFFRKTGRTISKRAAIAQIIEAMPEGGPSEAHAGAAMHFGSFHPSDGTEMTLSRLSVAATNAAMDCFTRAAKTDETKIRELELNSATKLALASAALCRALDHHRGPDWPEYIDDTLPPARRISTPDDILKYARSRDAGEKADDKKDDGKKDGEKDDRGKVNAQKGDSKPKDEPRPKEEEPSRSSA